MRKKTELCSSKTYCLSWSTFHTSLLSDCR